MKVEGEENSRGEKSDFTLFGHLTKQCTHVHVHLGEVHGAGPGDAGENTLRVFCQP